MNDSLKIVSIIGDAVLALKLPDEEATRIKTTELSMTLARHTPAKLVGLQIEEGDGRFVLPNILNYSSSGTRFVDSQVSFYFRC